MNESTTINLRVPKHWRDDFEEKAQRRGVTLSDVVRDALHEAYQSDLPIAWVVDFDRWHFIVACPTCPTGTTHRHGRGDDGMALGHRSGHGEACSSQGYVLKLAPAEISQAMVEASRHLNAKMGV